MPLTPTSQQQKVIAHTEGPLLLIDGSEAGKIFVLSNCISRSVTEKKVKLNNIPACPGKEPSAYELHDA